MSESEVEGDQFQLVYGINDESSDTSGCSSNLVDDRSSSKEPLSDDDNGADGTPPTTVVKPSSSVTADGDIDGIEDNNDEMPPKEGLEEFGDETVVTVDTPPVSSPSTVNLSQEVFKPQPQEGVFFNGIRYLGSSTVDAPVSENEANRKMKILKTQAGQPMPIILQIPPNNAGNIMLKDPSSKQILTAFAIRHVLFCARGDINTDLNDCLALNVIHKRSGVYHCHVFLCEIPEAVSF